MILFLPADTWIRLVLWMLIGLDIYACYGIKHSKLEYNQANRRGHLALNMIGIVLAILCVITGLWHQQTVGWEESKVLLIISFVFAFTHLAFYMVRIWKQTTKVFLIIFYMNSNERDLYNNKKIYKFAETVLQCRTHIN
mgnify:CR=1 FL=1